MSSRTNAVNLPKAAVAKAWDLVEELTFARTSRTPTPGVTATARAVGVSPTAVSCWEGGEYQPGLAAFIAWADSLGYDVVLQAREE